MNVSQPPKPLAEGNNQLNSESSHLNPVVVQNGSGVASLCKVLPKLELAPSASASPTVTEKKIQKVAQPEAAPQASSLENPEHEDSAQAETHSGFHSVQKGNPNRKKLQEAVKNKSHRSKGASESPEDVAKKSSERQLRHLCGKAEGLARSLFPSQRHVLTATPAQLIELAQLEKDYNSYLSHHPGQERLLEYPQLYKTDTDYELLISHYRISLYLYFVRCRHIEPSEPHKASIMAALAPAHPNFKAYEDSIDSSLNPLVTGLTNCFRMERIKAALPNSQLRKVGLVINGKDETQRAVLLFAHRCHEIFTTTIGLSSGRAGCEADTNKIFLDMMNKYFMPLISGMDAQWFGDTSLNASQYWMIRYALCMIQKSYEVLPVVLEGLGRCNAPHQGLVKYLPVLQHISEIMLAEFRDENTPDTDKEAIGFLADQLHKASTQPTGWLRKQFSVILEKYKQVIQRQKTDLPPSEEEKSQAWGISQLYTNALVTLDNFTVVNRLSQERKVSLAETAEMKKREAEALLKKWRENSEVEFSSESASPTKMQEGTQRGKRKGKGKGKGKAKVHQTKRGNHHPETTPASTGKSPQEEINPIQSKINAIGKLLLGGNPKKLTTALEQYKELLNGCTLNDEELLQVHMGMAEASLMLGLSLMRETVILRNNANTYQEKLTEGGLEATRSKEHLLKELLQKLPLLKRQFKALLTDAKQSLQAISALRKPNMDGDYDTSIKMIHGNYLDMQKDSEEMEKCQINLAEIFEQRKNYLKKAGLYYKQGDGTSIGIMSSASIRCAISVDSEFTEMLSQWRSVICELSKIVPADGTVNEATGGSL